MPSKKSAPEAMLSFSIGPVQEFIAAARTIRDLWTGSYLLSWLTARAIAVAKKRNGTLIHSGHEGNPLVALASGAVPANQDPRNLQSCLPNMFLAEFDAAADLKEIADEIRDAVEKEWDRISDAVRVALEAKLTLLAADPEWVERWRMQCRNQGDIRIAWLPAESRVQMLAQQLKMVDANKADAKGQSPDDFQLSLAILGRMAAADKNIRMFPLHEPEGLHLPKCNLRGDFSQMIPPKARPTDGSDIEIRGERLRTRDRFCAISLVKRFAWVAYLCEHAGFGDRYEAKHVWDAATIAAMDWLHHLRVDGQESFQEECNLLARKLGVPYSGHWLRWSKPDQKRDDEDISCPEKVWDLIKDARGRCKELGLPLSPPAYYAILMIDGDRMGDRFMKATREEHVAVSGKLSGFALNDVARIVEQDHHGMLVYAGGDDALALLPTATVLQCAKALRTGLGELKVPGEPLTASAGIAVVHCKHDLRDALQAAHQAEQLAKRRGRDQFAINVLRRSGEHTTATATWDCIDTVAGLVHTFAAGNSDRWAYHLRSECSEMIGNHDLSVYAPDLSAMIDAEQERLLRRSEGWDDKDGGVGAWKALVHATEMRGGSGLQARDTALTLVQTAAFLARGREM